VTVQQYDVVIIGAGGAGMMCAARAGQRGRKVALLDHTTKIGRKILISGGGRCNFTNTGATPDNFVSENPHFCKSALSRYQPEHFIELVRKYRIPFHEKKLGQLFCDRSAQEIVDLLVSECEEANVQFRTDCRIISVSKSGPFVIRTSTGDFQSDSLVIATGGLSIPQIGATGFGYEIARQFKLSIVETKPALVGLTLDRHMLTQISEISGVSVDSLVHCNGASFRENTLFTHDGLSGPAILQASLYWHHGQSIAIDLLPSFDTDKWLTACKKSGTKHDIKNILAEKLPKRFAEKFCALNKLDLKINQLQERDIAELSSMLHGWQISPNGTIGYRKAEVTRGGVDTNELSSKTMESKRVSGLYFIGEVVDVTGQLGVYNFQWAWASGVAAGSAC
jgi:predicted Rossmann fold flavoprotein